MPSPIAHCSLVALLRPLDRRGLLLGVFRTHPRALIVLALFACAMPDLDFGVGIFAPGTALGTHGMGMHSLFMMALTSLVLAGLWHLLFSGGFLAVFAVVLIASYSHLLLDMVTYQARGIALFWPFVDDRVRLPINAFYGVRHSGSGTWLTHLITVTSELAFLAVIWLISGRLSRSNHKPASIGAEAEKA